MHDCLCKRGIEVQAVVEIVEVLESFDRERYSASEANREEMSDALSHIKRLLAKVEMCQPRAPDMSSLIPD